MAYAVPALRGAELLRPSFKREKRRTGESLLKSVRQLIESVNDTLKGRLGLRTAWRPDLRGRRRPRRPARPRAGSAIRHNHKTGQPVMRSLNAYDH
uniref:hypothetical protein n=1 Tax=unclassified Streptomyces TaxID=2593676 RepID=UPI0018F34A03|nr:MULTISPECIES: hypothetical protein [unclassified Streptomyces]